MVAAMFLNGRGFLTQVSLGFVLEVMIVENENVCMDAVKYMVPPCTV